MPIITNYKIETDTHIIVWRMGEEDSVLKRELSVSNDEEKELSELSPKRQIEWITARYLVKQLTGKKYEKDAHGKPHLIGSDLHISISHSRDLLAVAVSKNYIGIDIQYQTERLKKIAWRVLNEEKLRQLDTTNELLHLHIYWGAKEALYKAHGKRDLHFKNNILIKPFSKLPTEIGLQFVTTASVIKNTFQKNFQIYFNCLDEYVLVIATEKE